MNIFRLSCARQSIFLLVIVLFLWHCEKSTGYEGNPEITVKLSLENGVYTTYESVSRQRSDTLRMDVKLRDVHISDLRVEAFIGNEGSVVIVENIEIISDSIARVVWIPKNKENEAYEYFGYKECFLKMSHIKSRLVVESGRFQLIGNIPFITIAPTPGNQFNFTDTINIDFGENRDFTKNIAVFMNSESMVDWSNRLLGIKSEEGSDPPILFRRVKLFPKDHEGTLINFDEPIRIGFFDYQTPDAEITIENIIINR